MPGVAADTVLLVCTANQCRSPMAEAMLRARLGDTAALAVTSAGFLQPGVPCPEEVLVVMEEIGLDLSGHRSRRISPEVVDDAAIVVTMGRQHTIDLAVEFPNAWERTFTVTGLLERAQSAGGRASGETLRGWVARINGGRQRSDLLRLSPRGDVSDPIGKTLRDFRQTRDRLSDFVDAFASYV